MPSTTRGQQRRRQPIRSPQQRSSTAPLTSTTRRHTAPPDYKQDYADVRHDLRLITILSTVLFAGMVAGAFLI